jgi:hypothetical protein
MEANYLKNIGLPAETNGAGEETGIVGCPDSLHAVNLRSSEGALLFSTGRFEFGDQLVDLARFGQLVMGAQLHGFERAVDRTLAGQNQAFGEEAQLRDFLLPESHDLCSCCTVRTPCNGGLPARPCQWAGPRFPGPAAGFSAAVSVHLCRGIAEDAPATAVCGESG